MSCIAAHVGEEVPLFANTRLFFVTFLNSKCYLMLNHDMADKGVVFQTIQ
ncbi:Uncharacterised protein [Salmonella enterica]|nr:Uncharacterised protein [Salmonella enterica]